MLLLRLAAITVAMGANNTRWFSIVIIGVIPITYTSRTKGVKRLKQSERRDLSLSRENGEFYHFLHYARSQFGSPSRSVDTTPLPLDGTARVRRRRLWFTFAAASGSPSPPLRFSHSTKKKAPQSDKKG